MRATHCVLVFTGLLLAASQLEASPITINVDAFTSMPVVVAEKSNGARGLKNWLDMFESATIPFGSSGGGSGALYSSRDQFGRSLLGVGPGFNMRSLRRPWVVVSGGGAHFTGPDIVRHHPNRRTRPSEWVVTSPEGASGSGGTGQFTGSGGTGAAVGAGGGSAIGGGGAVTAAAVPEPGSMLLLGSGLIAGVGALRRRTRKA